MKEMGISSVEKSTSGIKILSGKSRAFVSALDLRVGRLLGAASSLGAPTFVSVRMPGVSLSVARRSFENATRAHRLAEPKIFHSMGFILRRDAASTGVAGVIVYDATKAGTDAVRSFLRSATGREVAITSIDFSEIDFLLAGDGVDRCEGDCDGDAGLRRAFSLSLPAPRRWKPSIYFQQTQRRLVERIRSLRATMSLREIEAVLQNEQWISATGKPLKYANIWQIISRANAAAAQPRAASRPRSERLPMPIVF